MGQAGSESATEVDEELLATLPAVPEPPELAHEEADELSEASDEGHAGEVDAGSVCRPAQADLTDGTVGARAVDGEAGNTCKTVGEALGAAGVVLETGVVAKANTCSWNTT